MLARISDPRAAQFWDPGQMTSSAIWKAVDKHAGWPKDDLISTAGTIWNRCSCSRPARVGKTICPCPSSGGGDVVDVISEVRKRL